MKKLALNLDQLTVESFATDAAERATGTVRANDAYTDFISECPCTALPQCGSPRAGTCDPAGTCAYTCGDSCACPTMFDETCGIC
jgi:hypothetical protein